MNLRIAALLPSLCALQLITGSAIAAEPVEVFPVWPGKPPGQTREIGPERRIEGRPRPFYQITDVSTPTVSVFRPSRENHTGAAILVCPGGGLQRLAIEHEGIEVAEWLASKNITAFLLKYRVPERAAAGLQDAQRALSLIRSRAREWDVDPDGIGVLGFSAGGEIAAWLATHHTERQYEAADAADAISCKPDFAALIYPGGLLQGRPGQVKEAIASRINPATPPMFFAHAFDDSCENSLVMMLALKRVRVASELHVFHEGGHGFGVRDTGLPVGNWKQHLLAWMAPQGFLDKAFIRTYERELSGALQGSGPVPRLSQKQAVSLDDAYSAQRRLVRRALREDGIAGFKGGVITEAAQKNLGVQSPLTGVLLRSGRLDAQDKPVIDLAPGADMVVETELGYVVSVDISYKVLNDQQMREAVEHIVPVIELPRNYARRAGTMTAADLVAANIGSARFIAGQPKSPNDVQPDSLKIVLKRNGTTLHETSGSAVKGTQWSNLRTLINQITGQGYTVRAGSMIICGALGVIHPGEPGRYHADFDALGSIEFELR